MDYKTSEVLEFIEENDVKFIKLAFCDIFGNQKNITIMPTELKRAFYERTIICSLFLFWLSRTKQAP